MSYLNLLDLPLNKMRVHWACAHAHFLLRPAWACRHAPLCIALVQSGASAQSWCFVLFQLPIWLHRSCSISRTAAAGGTCYKCFTKHHDWADAPECTLDDDTTSWSVMSSGIFPFVASLPGRQDKMNSFLVHLCAENIALADRDRERERELASAAGWVSLRPLYISASIPRFRSGISFPLCVLFYFSKYRITRRQIIWQSLNRKQIWS